MTKKKAAYAALTLALCVASWLYGQMRVLTDDQGGWCAHFDTFMVCNQKAGTDYVLGE